MVGNLLEQQIINLFNKDLTQIYSINFIAKNLNKAYPHINKKVNSLISEGIIKKSIFGRSYICSINLENDLALAYLSIDEINAKEKKKKNVDKKTKEKIDEILSLSLSKNIIYSQGKIYVILDDAHKFALGRYKSDDVFLLNSEEFKKLILTQTSILKDHIIFQSYENYFQILREIATQLRGSNI